MLTIRLQRTGTKNKPAFRLVLAEKEKAAGKKFQEVLGSYNPRSKDFAVKDDVRLKYWIAQNVELSPTVRNLLIEKKVIEGKKVKAWSAKAKEGDAAAPAPAAASTPTPVPAPEAKVEEAPVSESAKTEEVAPAETSQA